MTPDLFHGAVDLLEPPQASGWVTPNLTPWTSRHLGVPACALQGIAGVPSLVFGTAHLAVLLGIAIVARLLLDPIATWQTRKTLAKLEGFEGDFERVHVTVLPPSYQITRLKLFAAKADGQPARCPSYTSNAPISPYPSPISCAPICPPACDLRARSSPSSSLRRPRSRPSPGGRATCPHSSPSCRRCECRPCRHRPRTRTL